MIFTLKTTVPVLVDGRTQKQAIAYMEIGGTLFDHFKFKPTPPATELVVELGYKVPISYYYFDTVDTGKVDEYNQPILEEKKRQLPAVPPLFFKKSEAQIIEQMMGGLTENFHTERFLQLIQGGISYQLSVSLPWGSSAIWELYNPQ